ncbi:MAG: DUF2061 domain-containing protein [Candidatus Margulisiibacteriota bacterium]
MDSDHSKGRLINRRWVRATLWRVLGTLITFVAAYVVTRRLALALTIAGIEVGVKVLLLPAYDWFWARFPADTVNRADYQI